MLLAPVRDLLFEPKGLGVFHLKGELTTGATDVPTRLPSSSEPPCRP